MEESRIHLRKALRILLFCLIWSHAAVSHPVQENIDSEERNVLEFTVQTNDTNTEPKESHHATQSDPDLSQIKLKQIVERIPTNEALELLEAVHLIRTHLDKTDENLDESATNEAPADSKDIIALTDSGSTDLANGPKQDQGLMTSVLKKRAVDDKEHSHASTEQTSLENVFHLFTPPAVTVRTALYSRTDVPSQSVVIPLVPYMSVFRALIFAALDFKETNKEVEDELNPFNAALKWDEDMACYVIIELLGQKNNELEYWEIAVFSPAKKIKYQDTCIPYEEELVLRPHDEVLLFHL